MTINIEQQGRRGPGDGQYHEPTSGRCKISCIHLCIHMYTYIYIHTHTRSINKYTCTRLHVCTSACMHVCLSCLLYMFLRHGALLWRSLRQSHCMLAPETSPDPRHTHRDVPHSPKLPSPWRVIKLKSLC